jgi:hypothetical protein
VALALKARTNRLRVPSELKRELGAAVAALSLTLLIAVLAAAAPIEDFLSAYHFIRVYPWYVYWRVAMVMFLLWIVAASFASKEKKLLCWLMVSSALVLAASHYAALAAERAAGGVEIELLPFLYKVKARGGETLKLDVAQVVLLATLVEYMVISRSSPRTASGGQQNPSRLRKA